MTHRPKNTSRQNRRAPLSARPATEESAKSKPDSANQHVTRLDAAICVALAVLVLAVFGQAVGFQFVNFDDNSYITGNSVVQNGLTLAGLRWAFTYGAIGHWHPLTWISHMLDCQVYGLWAGGHHVTNVVIHCATVVFLFLVLRQMTGARWRAAIVAAIWAVHPLRAESVAWIAERKDVLSGLFFVLTLGAYTRYVRYPCIGRYLCVAAMMALGLLAKDMLVTLPFLLLLLDWWPFNRWHSRSAERLIVEKVPLLLLSAASIIATFLVPEKIPANLRPPLAIRLENADVSYFFYLWRTIWPADLAVPYVFPMVYYPLWVWLGALLLLLAISALVFQARKSRPEFLIGWLWFLGMLVPVIGLVQISYYPRADRYTYLPQIGLLIAAVWAAGALAIRLRLPRWAIGATACGVIAIMGSLGWKQTAYWRNSTALWIHTLACTTENSMADFCYGNVLLDAGKTNEAIDWFHKALAISPGFADTWYGLGVAFQIKGDKAQAEAYYQRALDLDPGNLRANNDLGLAIVEAGRIDDGIAHYRRAIETDPNYPDAHYNLGVALQDKGDLDGAISEFQKTLVIVPKHVLALNNLGTALEQKGDVDGAIAQFKKALAINPNYALANNNLGDALQRKGELDEAIATYRATLKSDPKNSDSWYNLGVAFKQKGDAGQAVDSFEKAVALKPDFMEAQANLAEMQARSSDARLRNGAQAEAHAREADKLSGGDNPVVLGILASALAEEGRFNEAAETAKRAIQAAQVQGNSELAASLQADLQLYGQGKPFRNP